MAPCCFPLFQATAFHEMARTLVSCLLKARRGDLCFKICVRCALKEIEDYLHWGKIFRQHFQWLWLMGEPSMGRFIFLWFLRVILQVMFLKAGFLGSLPTQRNLRCDFLFHWSTSEPIDFRPPLIFCFV